jgi:glycosyltransferase involved in cell wall biosynthesis
LRSRDYSFVVIPISGGYRGGRMILLRFLPALIGAKQVLLVDTYGRAVTQSAAEFLFKSAYYESGQRLYDFSCAHLDVPVLFAAARTAVKLHQAQRRLPSWPRRKSRKPLRIGYMINSLDLGGAQRQLLALLSRLDRSRFEPELYLLTPIRGVWDDEVVKLCSTIVRVYGELNYTGLTWMNILWRMSDFLKSRRPDALHCWTQLPNLFGPIAAAYAGIPKIITGVRTLASHRAAQFVSFQPKLEKISARISDQILFNSQAAAADYQKYAGASRKKCEIVYNGADDEKWRPLPLARIQHLRRELAVEDGDKVIGFFGRLSEEKGVFDFIEAVKLISAKQSRVIALICGDGPLRLESEEIVQRSGCANRVRFLGFRRDVLELINLCDVVCLTSHLEGLPNSGIEAQLCGKPLVATDAGGTRETLLDGETGFLVPMKKPALIAAKTLQLLADPELLKNMGVQARKRAQARFSISVMVERMQQYYSAR